MIQGTHENQRLPWISTMPLFNHFEITNLYFSKEKNKKCTIFLRSQLRCFYGRPLCSWIVTVSMQNSWQRPNGSFILFSMVHVHVWCTILIKNPECSKAFGPFTSLWYMPSCKQLFLRGEINKNSQKKPQCHCVIICIFFGILLFQSVFINWVINILIIK